MSHNALVHNHKPKPDLKRGREFFYDLPTYNGGYVTYMNRPTIILGAGSAIEIDAPSTAKITEEIIKPNKYINYWGHSFSDKKTYFTTTTRIYNTLKDCYPGVPNFEQIFHVLEMLSSYHWVWNEDCKNPNMYSIIAPFINPTQAIVKPDEWKGLSSLISQCQFDIMKMVNKYDANFCLEKENNYLWYSDFWKKFSGFDLFNFNYDTTIEQTIKEYNDGFVNSDDERFQIFDPYKLLSNSSYKICHTHGCIVYFPERYKDPNYNIYNRNSHDIYKWNNFNLVKGMADSSSGNNPTSQGGETLHIGSIITGLCKTDKLTISPYNFYHHYLNTSIMNNNALLIVGYSFGDLYVNDLIERMNQLHGDNKRIVIITFIKPYEIKETDGTITKTFHGKEWDEKEINDREFLFFKKMMRDDSFRLQELDKTIKEEKSYTSKNGQVKLFVYGFKSAIQNHSSEILDFLTE